ncbi:transposase zinc-binding domain-containing protein [Neobacillus sp. NPDC093127]|uniref:transposase zinc-binding domain-containing protein n=1 Tax=Neobacillus sp. NPDC093127 TaxID=3364296 RepID=UPI0037FAA3F0
MFISGLLFLTIIGIFPAIGLFFTSLGLIYVAQGKEQVACPHCKKKQPVLKSSENFTCPKCQKLTVINWA